MYAYNCTGSYAPYADNLLAYEPTAIRTTILTESTSFARILQSATHLALSPMAENLKQKAIRSYTISCQSFSVS